MRTRPDIPDNQLQRGERVLLPDGEYDFQVRSAKDKVSASSGNDMIELSLTVWAKDGTEHTIFDYLVDAEASEWKIRSFCRATGLSAVYETGNLSYLDCMNVSGRLILKTQQVRTVNGKTYDARNVVKTYVPATTDAPATSAKPDIEGVGSLNTRGGATVAADADESIPF